jgi:hypothetical protein
MRAFDAIEVNDEYLLGIYGSDVFGSIKLYFVRKNPNFNLEFYVEVPAKDAVYFKIVHKTRTAVGLYLFQSNNTVEELVITKNKEKAFS